MVYQLASSCVCGPIQSGITSTSFEQHSTAQHASRRQFVSSFFRFGSLLSDSRHARILPHRLSRSTTRTASPRHALHPRLERLVLNPRGLLLGVVLLDELQTIFQVPFQLEGPLLSVSLPRGLLRGSHPAEPRHLVPVLVQNQVPRGIPSGSGLAAEAPVRPVLDGGLPQVVGDPLADPRSTPRLSRRLGDVVAEGGHGLHRDLLRLESVFAVLAQVSEGGSHRCARSFFRLRRLLLIVAVVCCDGQRLSGQQPMS
mmetsp:Transcript_24987/g.58633  ORF Transcript_24987/g.58633 Transcript_24987/m.58633 type:complete len:256 (+) Transcript_24987:182-949(+)